MNLIWILLTLGLSILNGPFAYADDGAAGFEWASAREVYEKSECYTESGGFLRNSKAFTDGCLSFLGEAPSGSEDETPRAEATEEESAPLESEKVSSDDEETPSQAEEEKLSNKDFIQDSWGKS